MPIIRLTSRLAHLVAVVLESVGLYWPRHSRIAREAFRRRYPHLIVEKTWTRAREADRYVVAVFFTTPGFVSFPIEYQLCAVSRDLASVEELPTDPTSPYRILDYK